MTELVDEDRGECGRDQADEKEKANTCIHRRSAPTDDGKVDTMFFALGGGAFLLLTWLAFRYFHAVGG